jgi:phosphohistidine phosphatase SixA/8-oxo-dGTP pyrophosphatase MutT (NUDIX family)
VTDERSVDRELLAAGGVLWRRTGDSANPVEIAVVHRPRYDDWSLPKGKPDPGEHLVRTARREVLEESGFDVPLGRPLGSVQYPVPQGLKQVRFWAMETPAALPRAEVQDVAEVDELRWLPSKSAIDLLTHPHDRATVKRLGHKPVSTTTILLVRHAHAGQRSLWRGDDRKRPLDERGSHQSRELADFVPAFGPRRVLAADLTRCEQTAGPLAAALGLPVETDVLLSDVAHAKSAARTRARIRALARAGSAVVVSQGDTVPALVAALADKDRVVLPPGTEKVPARKGSIWALSFVGDRLVDLEYFADAEPILN